MMKKLGLTEIGARMNDKVHFLIPPYEDPRQQHLLKMIKKTQLDEHEFWMERTKEEFLAGGGNPEEYERFREISERLKPILQQQIEEGKYTACVGRTAISERLASRPCPISRRFGVPTRPVSPVAKGGML